MQKCRYNQLRVLSEGKANYIQQWDFRQIDDSFLLLTNLFQNALDYFPQSAIEWNNLCSQSRTSLPLNYFRDDHIQSMENENTKMCNFITVLHSRGVELDDLKDPSQPKPFYDCGSKDNDLVVGLGDDNFVFNSSCFHVYYQGYWEYLISVKTCSKTSSHSLASLCIIVTEARGSFTWLSSLSSWLIASLSKAANVSFIMYLYYMLIRLHLNNFELL